MAYTSFVEDLVECIVGATNKYGVRSPKRTDDIHSFIKTFIETQNSNLSCIIEKPLQTELGTFKVDLAIFDRRTGRLCACVLFKALASSIAKNCKNYEHNKIGEAVKAKSGMDSDTKLVYIDVIPIRCPTYKKGKISAWEKRNPENVRKNAVRLQTVTNSGRTRPIIDDIYTIFVDYEYDDVYKKIAIKSIVDSSDIARFVQLLAELVPVGEQTM